MVDLVIRPSGLADPERAWALQLRLHDSSGETEYLTLARLSRRRAEYVLQAGKAFWLFGAPTESPAPPDQAEFRELARFSRLAALGTERATLEIENARASEWGAGIAARNERINGIDGEIAVLLAQQAEQSHGRQ